MLAMKGVSSAYASNSSSGRSTPSRPAMAGRCATAFVDPPRAMQTRIAFSKAARCHDLRWSKALSHHLHDAPAARLSKAEPERSRGRGWPPLRAASFQAPRPCWPSWMPSP